MGQTCSTETCCGKEGQQHEIPGDLTSMNYSVNPSDLNQKFRPAEMSESARQRLIELGASNNPGQMSMLLRRVIMIQSLFRGYMVRKRLEEIRSVVQNGTENGKFDDSISETELFSNVKVKEVYDQ